MWRGKKVIVIFPTYNEKDSIKNAVSEMFAEEYVDDVIVVNNNAVFGTDEEVKKTKAKLIYEEKQGYGYSIKCGLKEALRLEASFIIISEPDGTFISHDVVKLLAYSDGFDVVFGTRTTKELIMQGAIWEFFLNGETGQLQKW